MAMTPEQARFLADFSANLFEQEIETTARVLAAVPDPLFRSMANNHAVHHRGQLATYLRPVGSKVPSIYGGSADDPM